MTLESAAVKPDTWILNVYPMLLGIVQKRTGYDASQALDIVHDTILAIYDSIDRFDPEKGTFQQWSAGILRNMIYRHFERRGRREKLEDDEPMDEHADDAVAEPVIQSIVKEINGVINRTFDGVPPLYKDVLQLRYRENKPLKAIASQMGLPLGTVKARLSRATDILKGALNFQHTTVRTFLDGS